MKKSFCFSVIVLVATLSFVPSGSFAQDRTLPGKLTAGTVDLRLSLRDLWVGHVFWVRNVVLEAKGGNTAAVKVAEDQVTDNAKTLAAMIVPYYGREAGDKFSILLLAYYAAIKEYMGVAYLGDRVAQKATISAAEKRGAELAGFLSSLNPNWPGPALASIFASQVAQHIVQIDHVNAGDFAAEAKTWKEMKNYAYTIADTMAQGIVMQFPDKF